MKKTIEVQNERYTYLHEHRYRLNQNTLNIYGGRNYG